MSPRGTPLLFIAAATVALSWAHIYDYTAADSRDIYTTIRAYLYITIIIIYFDTVHPNILLLSILLKYGDLLF